jgi:signal transduction histidine kinase
MPDEVVDEYLVPVWSGVAGTSGRVLLGCFWLPVVVRREPDLVVGWTQSFADWFGEVIPGAEAEAARSAGSRALERAVSILLGGDASTLYAAFLKTALDEIPAEGGSIFTVHEEDGERVLRLAWTTGIGGRPSTQWDDVRYRLGENLTGTIAKESGPVSLLDVDAERGRRGIGPPRFVETLQSRPTTWLGCPVRNSRDELTAFLRLVNRRLEGAGSGEPTGFSTGDVELARSLARAAAQLHDLQAQQREHQAVLIGSFHELRAPVVAIRSRAHRLVLRPDDPRATEKHRDIETDAEMLLDALDTIEVASRDRSLRPEPTRLYSDVVAPLRHGLRVVALREGYKDLIVVAEDLRRMSPLNVDRVMVRQVFSNLMINAIRYGPKGEDHVRIQIGYQASRDTYEVFVRDWGMGIRPDATRKVFELHHRTEEARARCPPGTGVGLFVVRRVMEKHGGSVRIANPAGPTVFALTFPATLRVSRGGTQARRGS